MKRASGIPACALSLLIGVQCHAAAPRFEKVSDHCYFFESKGEAANAAAVVSDDGVLLVNPPGEADPSAALEALRKLTTRPVRWIVHTDYRFKRSGGARRFVEQGALVLGSRQLDILASEAPAAPDANTAKAPDSAAPTRLVFKHQMRVYPGGVEVRMIALHTKALTGGDVIVFVPSEKVLMVGNLYVAGRFPDIDVTPGGGSVLGWLDGMKQAIDAVPLLKAAIPLKTEIKPGEEEKSLEETVAVLPARGPKSNLQEMKDLLEAAHKLRAEIAKQVTAGRDSDTFLASPAAEPFRSFENLDGFVRQLFDALSQK